MISYPRFLLSCVLIGLSCLGVWYFTPVPQTPIIFTYPTSPSSIIQELESELKQKKIDKATIQSAKLYRLYGCSTTLAYPTAVEAIAFDVPVLIATAIVIVESTCNPRAISKAGATGLMQIMPQMHHITRKALFDQQTNLRIGIRYLSELIHMYGLETGIAYYFGVTPGSQAAWEYSQRVMNIAK